VEGLSAAVVTAGYGNRPINDPRGFDCWQSGVGDSSVFAGRVGNVSSEPGSRSSIRPGVTMPARCQRRQNQGVERPWAVDERSHSAIWTSKRDNNWLT
jgi:hypothetical protein